MKNETFVITIITFPNIILVLTATWGMPYDYPHSAAQKTESEGG